MFSPSEELFIFISTDCYLVKSTLYRLNPNPVLNLYAAVVLQSMITLISNSLCVKIPLSWLFCSSPSSYLCFLWSEIYFYAVVNKFLWSNPCSIFFCLHQPFYIVHSTEVSGYLLPFFISLYSPNTLSAETNCQD